MNRHPISVTPAADHDFLQPLLGADKTLSQAYQYSGTVRVDPRWAIPIMFGLVVALVLWLVPRSASSAIHPAALEVELAQQYLLADQPERAEALLVPVAADLHGGEVAKNARRLLKEIRSRGAVR